MGNVVIFYTDCNFQGQKSELKPGKYNINEMGIPNDSLSSVKVPKGIRVTLFEHANFEGRRLVLDADEPCLLNRTVEGLNFNDQASSIFIEQVGEIANQAAELEQRKRQATEQAQLRRKQDVEQNLTKDVVFKKAPAESYNFYQGLDSGGNDIRRSNNQDNAEALMQECNEDPNCLGFNTNGFLKNKLNPKDSWRKWTDEPKKGFYAKESKDKELETVQIREINVKNSQTLISEPVFAVVLSDGNDWINLSQLVVTNLQGVNVAKGAKTQSSGVGFDAPESNAVDGEEASRPHPKEYHSSGQKAFFKVFLPNPDIITSVTVYNRADCCQERMASGYKIKLLGKDDKILFTSDNLTKESKQVINIPIQKGIKENVVKVPNSVQNVVNAVENSVPVQRSVQNVVNAVENSVPVVSQISNNDKLVKDITESVLKSLRNEQLSCKAPDSKPVDCKPVDCKPVDSKPVNCKPVNCKAVNCKINSKKSSKKSSKKLIYKEKFENTENDDTLCYFIMLSLLLILFYIYKNNFKI